MSTTHYIRGTTSGYTPVGMSYMNPHDLFTSKTDGSDYLQANMGRFTSASRGASALGASVTSVTGPTNGIDLASSGPMPYTYVSPPFSADTTISGTITVNLWAQEASMSANAAIGGRLFHWNAQTGALTEFGSGINTTELGTSYAVRQFTISPTSTAFAKGDRYYFIPYFDDASGVTMASGHSLSFTCGSSTADTEGDSWIQFTETFSVVETAPGGSTLYFTNTASDVSTASVDLKIWTSRGSGATTSTTSYPGTATFSYQITNSGGGTVIDWFTERVNAFTLSGPVLCHLRGGSTESLQDTVFSVEIAVVASDGTSPTVYGKTRSNDGFSGTEAALTDFWVTGDDISVTAGQRIRVRIGIGDPHNLYDSTQPGSGSAYFYYAGSSGASGDSYVKFDQTLVLYNPAETKTGNFTVDATLAKAGEDSFTVDAELFSEGIAWTVPANLVVIYPMPELTFQTPVSTTPLHFQMQLDKVDTFDGANLRDLESNMDQTNWEYFNDSSWVALPATGMPAQYTGNPARYRVTSPLSAGTWYRRVRAG